MKKLLSVILCTIMCISAFSVPAFADDGDKVGELIIQIKDKFDISDDVFVFEDYSKEDYSNEVTYYLRWGAKNEDYTYQPYISVRIEEDGDIQSYRLGSNYEKEISLQAFSNEYVLEKATQMLKIIAPDRAGKVAKGKVTYSYDYTIDFERVENNIPVAGDHITILLDPNTLEITNYNAYWTETEFPTPENIITKDAASNIFKTKIGYELIYNINTEKSEIKEIYLSYAPISTSAYVDAFTGDAKIHDGVLYRYSGGAGALKNEAAMDMSAALSPEEQKLVDEINKMLTKEEAEKIVRSMAELNIRADADVTNYSVYKNQYGDYIANLSFTKNSKEQYYYANAAIDVPEKTLISFNCSANNDVKSSFSCDMAKNKAESFLKKYYSEKLAETKPQYAIGEAQDKYTFTYNRYANDVRVKNNDISISIDEHTGEIRSFSINRADTQFPTAANALDTEKIYEKVLTEENFRLQYMPSTEYVYDESSGKEIKNTECALGYTLCEYPIYNAETGIEIDYSGKPVEQKFKGYTDTEYHYCNNAAAALANIGIYFEGEKLNPDSAVTQAEYLKLLLKAVYSINLADNDEIYRYAVREGILTQEEIGNALTRIEAVKYFINAIGFKNAAEIKGIYNCPFNDVAYEKQGYAALAGGLGIINTQTDILRADSLATRAEALTMIYNYLIK